MDKKSRAIVNSILNELSIARYDIDRWVRDIALVCQTLRCVEHISEDIDARIKCASTICDLLNRDIRSTLRKIEEREK